MQPRGVPCHPPPTRCSPSPTRSTADWTRASTGTRRRASAGRPHRACPPAISSTRAGALLARDLNPSLLPLATPACAGRRRASAGLDAVGVEDSYPPGSVTVSDCYPALLPTLGAQDHRRQSDALLFRHPASDHGRTTAVDHSPATPREPRPLLHRRLTTGRPMLRCAHLRRGGRLSAAPFEQCAAIATGGVHAAWQVSWQGPEHLLSGSDPVAMGTVLQGQYR